MIPGQAIRHQKQAVRCKNQAAQNQRQAVRYHRKQYVYTEDRQVVSAGWQKAAQQHHGTLRGIYAPVPVIAIHTYPHLT